MHKSLQFLQKETLISLQYRHLALETLENLNKLLKVTHSLALKWHLEN